MVVDAVKDLEIGKYSAIGTETRLGKTIYWIARLEARLPADTRSFPEQSARSQVRTRFFDGYRCSNIAGTRGAAHLGAQPP